MKTQFLTLTKTLLTMGAIVSTVAIAHGHEDDKHVLPFPKCEMTRLGCLDKNGPIVPIDQPIFIQVGLEINIKCQAKAQDGNHYVLNFHMYKKAQLNSEKQSLSLNYYLTPGEYGVLSFYGNPVNKDLVTPAAIAGYYPNASIEASSVENQLVISAYDSNATRLGTVDTEAKIQIPTQTSSSQSLQIFSMAKKTTKMKFVEGEFVPVSTDSAITFTETNCVYF